MALEPGTIRSFDALKRALEFGRRGEDDAEHGSRLFVVRCCHAGAGALRDTVVVAAARFGWKPMWSRGRVVEEDQRMKKTSTRNAGARGTAAQSKARPGIGARIHPVVIYPIRQPDDYRDLEGLYELVARLDADRERYARPITVMDRKTWHAAQGNRSFDSFRKETVGRYSDIVDAWCVDTCQMWYSGLGEASERGGADDVYWLIPGDFNYGSAVGREVLGRLHDLPEIVLELGQDLCIGEIATEPSHSKHLIDAYGTFALLYNWFPREAAEIRTYTERPRSEFFAVRHGFLRQMLCQRWYAYEQTVVMLLHAVFANQQISRFFVGQISDLPEGRESFASAAQQVERTERVLKSVWRERNQPRSGWVEEYRALEEQSGQVRAAALLILQNALR